MATKVTTFNINQDIWKNFNKKLIDKEQNKRELISRLIKEFISGELNIDIFGEPLKENFTAGLHIDESAWLDFDLYLAKQRKLYTGNIKRQKLLSKGNTLAKLIKYYIELENGGILNEENR